jgi:benzoylformate decarboxylase
MFDGGVQVFGQFADDEHIDVVEVGRQTAEVLQRPYRGEQAQFAAEPHAILVEESPSNLASLHTAWPITEPDTFYTFASGVLGWDLPAAAGIALAERDSGRNRPVIAVIGDGSFQYSVQSIWTAARLRLPMLIVVVQNQEYAILKSFAALEHAPGVPGLDIPGLDIVSIARGYGCDAARVADLDALPQAVASAWTKQGPTVLEIPVSPQVPPLL